jgi:hypothetical protein
MWSHLMNDTLSAEVLQALLFPFSPDGAVSTKAFSSISFSHGHLNHIQAAGARSHVVD